MINSSRTPIRSLSDMTEKTKEFIIFSIMGYMPSERVKNSILQKAIDFKWTDCEEFGTNVYETMSPEDQLIAAGFEWRKQYWEYYFEENDTDGKEPRKIV